ncbi:yop-1 [Pristionchus pacificus]|uniref:Receptor expression-enhancing protein n=1 Tax=Pristionchus pacificus TaxID=54126 RepID=A0A2A6CCT6_PRIPA|nr:yop-1 [Pristionchus pacificus]|eukprot:PDM75927.1 yop-1 [Pristionchus pacificus]
MSVPPQLQKVIDDVDKQLHEKGSLTDMLGMVESKTGIKRLHIVLGAFGLQALYLVFGHFAGLVCNIIGFLYPAYVSVMAIESAGKEDDTQWLTYWVVFAVLSVCEFFAQQIVAVFPIYWLVKAVFCIWLYLPATKGATILYQKGIRPFVLKNQSSIDQAARKVADAAKDVVGEVKQRLE